MKYKITRIVIGSTLDKDIAPQSVRTTARGWEQVLAFRMEDINQAMTRAARYQHTWGHPNRYYLVEEYP